jgi:hypothetical protein
MVTTFTTGSMSTSAIPRTKRRAGQHDELLEPGNDLRMGIGYWHRSSTRIVAPKASSASSKKAKWSAHQRSEPPRLITVSTTARDEHRSHRSAAVRCWAGFLSSETFIPSNVLYLYGDSFVAKARWTHRRKTSLWTNLTPALKRGSAATTTSCPLTGTKQRLRGDSPSYVDPPAKTIGPVARPASDHRLPSAATGMSTVD